MFNASLQTERDLGINYWEDEAPELKGVSVTVPAPDGAGKAVDWADRFEHVIGDNV
jgi:hypothetical protein